MSSETYIVGSGKVYFDKFLPGTMIGEGERYLGNTPALSIKAATTTLERVDSQAGVRVKTDSYNIARDYTGSFQTDDVNIDNLAEWFGGVAIGNPADAAHFPATTFTMKAGRFYQLGRTVSSPSGARNVSNVLVSIGGLAYSSIGNLDIDYDLGRVSLSAGSAIADGTVVTLSYDARIATRNITSTGGNSIKGSLRFISKNMYGVDRNYYMPYVKLVPDSDLGLKTGDWQSLTFSVTVLKLNDLTEFVYVDEAPSFVGITLNQEQALTYGSEAQVIMWVNELYNVINVTLPANQSLGN